MLAETVHREVHRLLAGRIVEVDPRQIDAFLGAIPRSVDAGAFAAGRVTTSAIAAHD
jgi:hypothetical protein